MGPGGSERYELNEISWWARWTRFTWISNRAYFMHSRKFDELFFNHSGFVAAEPRWSETVSEATMMFQAERLRPCFYVQDVKGFARIRNELVSRGYIATDAMSVMKMRNPSFNINQEVRAEVTKKEGLEDWCEAYLMSFYGNVKLFRSTLQIVRDMAGLEEVAFVSAKYKGATAGTLALHRSGDITGVYCVGVVPRYRRKRIATTMLQFAHEFSRKTASELILQTMLSDAVEGFYTRMGFTRRYTKTVFVGPA